jgi:Ca-activated chloride channel family protein
MNATDVKPSRLERAKLKLLDILRMRGAGQTALVVYAANAFTVTPLTDDTATISNMVPTLDTSLMPAQGSDATRAIAKAVKLLHQAGVKKGDILLMTDGLRASDLDAIKALPEKGIRLSILGFGTPEGSPIPLEGGFLHDSSGAIVIPKLHPGLLRSAAKLGGGIYLNMQADRSDTRRLSKLFNSRHGQNKAVATKLTADIWREEGPWLLLLVIPLAALGARRGWLASFLCLLFVMQMLPQPVYAAGLLDTLKQDSHFLWQRPDQKAAEALKNGDAKTAAKLFQQPDWKAVAQYRAGDFAAAAKGLEPSKKSDALYNRGNALAQMHKYKDAIDAYDQALKLNPDNADAKYNREQVEKALKQQQKQQQSNNQNNKQDNKKNQKQSDKQNSDQNQKDKKQSKQQNNKQQNQQSSDKKNSDQNKDKNQQNQKQSDKKSNGQQKQQNQDQDQKQDQKQQQSQSDQQKNKKSPSEQKQKAPETEKEKNNLRAEQDKEHQQKPEQQNAQQQKVAGDQENAKAKEDDEAAEQWLRRIPDDPGGLLRRKFLYQYSRLPNQVEDKQPW